MVRLMKDSGIPWIGEIPDNWETPKVLQCLQMPITDGPHTTPEFFDEGIPFISAEAVSSGNGRISFEHKRGYISREFYNECCQKYVPQIDDVYMIKSGATTGRVAIVDTDQVFTIWSPLAVFRADPKKILPFFLFYSLQADYFQKQIENAWSFGTQQNIGMRVLEKIKLCLPPVCIQTRIVNFLDAECARIDSIIEQTCATVEEYKKLKQSIITQAVTKGIRPNRRMKDSGIEWIGEIPEEWEVVKFKYIAKVKSNLVAPDEYKDYPQVSPENIEKGSGRLLPCKSVAEVGVISGNHLFYKGQILYSKIRPKLNKVAIAPFDGLCSADMYPIETTLNKRFFLYALLSDAFLANIGFITENRVKMPKINQEELNEIFIAVPQDHEQGEIVGYLDKVCFETEDIVSKKERFVADLENYKKSLIYEYVTGKKEVI